MSKMFTPCGFFKRHVDLSSYYRIVRVKRDGTPDLKAPVYRLDAVSNAAWAEKRWAEVSKMNPQSVYTIVPPADVIALNVAIAEAEIASLFADGILK